jgi:hypothetical protein
MPGLRLRHLTRGLCRDRALRVQVSITLFVDEADKMETDAKEIVGEGCLSGRFGPHQLPPGWIVWMAGNRAGDRSGSTKELVHLINRRREIDVTDDLESLLNWMNENGCM